MGRSIITMYMYGDMTEYWIYKYSDIGVFSDIVYYSTMTNNIIIVIYYIIDSTIYVVIIYMIYISYNDYVKKLYHYDIDSRVYILI